MREFWVSSGHHLSRQNEAGELVATPELMTAWLARPELAPPPEACDAERALHASLLADPFSNVTERDIAALADVDARENWTFFIRFRDRLIAAPSIEQAYRDLARAALLVLPGQAVLLSPACASFDMFRNYGHRAEVFVGAVQRIAEEDGQPC